jgi:quercetin dioxygenase-like cupin family protein
MRLAGFLGTLGIALALQQGVAQAADEGGAAHQVITPVQVQKTVKGSADFFTGDVWITMNFLGDKAVDYSAGTVTFAPGARSSWHVHPKGQLLLVTAGTGWTQEAGGPVQEVHAGDVIWCPPGVKHWHGATPATSMTHIAITSANEGKAVEWFEKVSDAEYHR